ncbi:hypothetical protein FJT64_020788 [Amphibalanus amphitrite]|uniref:Uncharacterized protein n=1 Tax=Amphibalanus amphitrite TaxID=1232801 RepID=A0A6A4X0U1_AMPAM|nr:hypothetical protein FJT64_020788 [Amphibalanus amphitrite]
MEPEEDPDIVRASSKVPDEFLNKKTDQARSLREKFESWSPPAERGFTVEEDCKPTPEITRNLRSKFESLKEQPKPQPQTQHRTSKFIVSNLDLLDGEGRPVLYVKWVKKGGEVTGVKRS